MTHAQEAAAFILANRNSDGSPRQRGHLWSPGLLRAAIRRRWPTVLLVEAYAWATWMAGERARGAA